MTRTLTPMLIILVMSSSLAVQADEFKAEGLTKPVVPKGREFAVKVMCPMVALGDSLTLGCDV